MRRLLVRRSVTAVGIYSSVLLGFGATVAASRLLHGTQRFGDYATILFAVSLMQSFFDLTVEEAVVKYGFRYVAREDWPRLRRLFTSAVWFKCIGAVLAAVGLVVFALLGPHRLQAPLFVAAFIPIGQSLEGLAGVMLYLRGRYDIRSLFLTWSMTLRLAGVAVGAYERQLLGAVIGMLVAQVVATLSIAAVGLIGFRRFPTAGGGRLAEDRREIASFIVQSSIATGVLSLRGGLAPLLLGAVTSTKQTGLFKIAQSPQSGFQAVSAPARMVLLTEQTRDWEHGRQSAVLRGVRRYSFVAVGLSIVAVPPLWIFIPTLIRHINGSEYVGASGAARLFLLTAAVQLVVGWTKSFPVTIGRPELRVWTHGLETLVVLPLVVVFGLLWGATGAAGAVLAGMCVFAAVWFVLLARVRPSDSPPPLSLAQELAAEQSETGAVLH
jgi:O-antigen/teichoic acid export membrane protein